MKITGYRLIDTVRDWGRPIGDVNGIIASGVTECRIVVLETDEGVEGIGLGAPTNIEALFPALEGKDPRAVASLYDAMLGQVFKIGHQGSVFGSIASLDMALWDIKAKLAGEPLWRLLGAGDRWIPGYASGLDYGLSDDELHAWYSTLADRGFAAGKLKGGLSVQDDLRRMDIMESSLRRNSNQPALMLDANEFWTLKEAVRYVSQLEQKIDLTWIEEPLRRWDAKGHARLSASIKAAVATGENLTGLEQFKPLLDAGAVDIVQTGAVWGITYFLRVAHAAHARDLPISPVGLTSMPAVSHAAAAVPNHMTAEVQALDHPIGVTIDEEFTDGGILLGNSPGVGVTIDEQAIATHRNGNGDASWVIPAGPHVRHVNTNFRLHSDATMDTREPGQ